MAQRCPRDDWLNQTTGPTKTPEVCGNLPCHTPDHWPFVLPDYLEFVDWAGRSVRDDKQGATELGHRFLKGIS